MASLVGYAQMVLLALTLAGDFIFKSLNFEEHPAWFKWMKENKMQCFGLFMLSNSVAASFLQSGAFEVELDGEVVFSKLEMGRMPQVRELQEALRVAGISQAPGVSGV